MKKAGLRFWFPIALWLLQAISEILAFAAVYKLGVVPDNLLVFAVVGLVVLLLIPGVMLLPFKKSFGNVRRWIAAGLSVLVIIGCWIGYSVVSKVQNTLDNMVTDEPEGVPVAIYVRKDDPACTLEDAKDYRFASVENYEAARTGFVLDSLGTTLNKEIAVSLYPSVFDMVDGLLSGDVDALILNPAYVDILEEMDGYTDYSDKTRILYEVMTPQKLEEDVPPETTAPEGTEPTETTVPVVKNITKDPFVVYISGTDTKAKVFRTCRSDVNILMVVNPAMKQILLLNTPRDYYVENPAGNNARDKLTHCGMYGIENSVKTLSQLYGIDIDYYARINFSGFEKVIDAIGGITVYSTQSFTTCDTYFQKGPNTLDGEKALIFARERKKVAGGDNGRGKNQMRVISAVINKMTSSTALIGNFSEILTSLGDMFTMSVPAEDVAALVKMQLKEMPSWDIKSFAVTGKNARNVTYSMPGRNLSVMYVDDAYVAHGAGLVNKMLSGEVITDEDLQMNKPNS